MENAEKRIDQFIDENLLDWSEQVILDPTRRLAREVGLSQNAQNTITIEKVDFLKAQLMWDYEGADGEPLHEFLENGTDPHIIEAKGKINGGSDYLQWKDFGGQFIYRKKVDHPGTDGYKILARGWEQNMEQLQRRIIEETNNWLEVNKLG